MDGWTDRDMDDGWKLMDETRICCSGLHRSLMPEACTQHLISVLYVC